MAPYSPSRDRDRGRYGVTAQNTRLAIRHDECNPISAHPSPVLSPQIFSRKGSICVISSFFFCCALHLSDKLDQIVSRGDRGQSVTCMYLHHIRHYACSNQCISLSCWLTPTDAGHSHCKVRQCNCSSPQCHGRSWPSQPTLQRAMQNTKAIPESRRASLIVLRVSDEVNWHPSSLRRQQPNHTKAPSKRQKPK